MVSTEQQLLPRLAAGIEGPAYLYTTERAVGQQSAVFTGEGYPLRYCLVNNIHRYLRKTVNVRFAAAVVTTFDGIVEQAVDGVTVVLVVLSGVDATLGGDGVRTTGAIVEGEYLDLIT